MSSRKFQGNFLYLPQQDILVTSQGFVSPDSFFGFGWRSLAGAVSGNKTDSCLCGVFVPGKRFIWNKMGRAKGFVPLKTFSRDQMPQAEGFVPRERVSGTKSSRVSPFPERRDLRRG